MRTFFSAIAEAERFLAGFESYRNSLIQAGVSGQLTAQWRAQNGIKREEWVTHNLQSARIGKMGWRRNAAKIKFRLLGKWHNPVGDPERCKELDPKRHSRPCHPNGH
ncbi:hypothetical protein BJU21_09555 [Corynebacterium diphtheriae]|nr:hypothetical protein BJU21_09555 [Corynebacterium diphtheriae]OWM97411.1 hypothetical protein AY481_11735 [Corynebacterium diphtheriae bv. mitis]